MIAEEAYVLSKSFTNNSLKGITGALAGKNCTIKSSTKTDGVTTVVFAWTADDGTEKTTTIQVNDGAKGDIGIGIDNVTINANSHLIVTLSDGSTIDAGLIQGGSGTDDYEDLINRPKIEGVDLIGNKTFEDLGVASATDLAQTNGHLQDKVDKTDIVTELSDASTDDEVVGALTAYNELQKLELANKEQFATASGDYITVNDSVNGKLVELGIKGNSVQKTYSGKNLLVYPYTDTTNVNSGVTFTDNGDGSITINGTNTTDQWLYFWLFGSSTSDESKRENLYGKQLVVSGLKTAVGSIKLESYYKTTDGKEYWVKPTGNDNDYFTITYPSKSEVALMNLAFVIYPNGVVNNVTVKPMIRLATETDSSYEPYVGGTPSPNPLYPQTINSVGDDGNLVVTSCGKNVLKNTNGDSFLHTGITYTKNSDGSISCTGTQTGHSYYPLNDDLKVDFKGKYILSGNTTTNSNEWGYCLFLQLELEDGSFRYIFNNNPDEVVADFSQYPTLKYVRPYIRVGKDAPALTDKTVTFYPMLRPYGTDGTYEPYHETTTTIPLSEPLRSIGDVKDEITYQDGKWGVLRRIKKLVADTPKLINPDGALTGTTYDILVNFEFDAQDSYNAVNKISDMSKHIFRNFQSINIWDKDECGVYISWAGSISARLSSSICGSTLDEVKAYFKNNPLIGQYVLATPVFESFTDQTLPYLSTYDGVTNISNDDALSAEMTVKYPTTDASGVGSQNESRIADIEETIRTSDRLIFAEELQTVLGVELTYITAVCRKKNGIAFVTISFDMTAGSIENKTIVDGVTALGLPKPLDSVNIVGGYADTFGGLIHFQPDGSIITRLNPSATNFKTSFSYIYE